MKGFAEAWSAARVRILQDKDELGKLFDLVRQFKCQSFIEIGSMWGGSFYVLSQAIPVGGCVVTIEKVRNEDEENSRTEICRRLSDEGYDVKQLKGDSHNESLVSDAGKTDFVFIDGDHTYKGAKSDFENYRGAKLTAFHDVANGRQFVPKLWGELISGNRNPRYKMFINEKVRYGIGVIIH